jgi:hypothetical protein
MVLLTFQVSVGKDEPPKLPSLTLGVVRCVPSARAPMSVWFERRGVLDQERHRVREHILRTHVASPKCGEPTSATAVNEPGMGSSADDEGEEGIDRSLDRTGALLYLSE